MKFIPGTGKRTPSPPKLHPWNVDRVQFARLLCEIVATQPALDMGALCEAMDLTSDDIDELFDRAHIAWEKAKGV